MYAGRSRLAVHDAHDRRQRRDAGSLARPGRRSARAWCCSSTATGPASAPCSARRSRFRKLGYSTLLVDFRGSGGSSEATTTIGVLEADDVAAAVAFARTTWPGRAAHSLRPVDGGGRHSAGGGARRHGRRDRGRMPVRPTADHGRTSLRVDGRAVVPDGPAAVVLGRRAERLRRVRSQPGRIRRAAFAARRWSCTGAGRAWFTRPEAEAIYAALAGPKQWELFADARPSVVLLEMPGPLDHRS